MKLRKGDNVQIITGKDKGKRGKILQVDRRSGRILVEGANVFKKHQRPKKQGEKGETITISRPLNASNTMLVCRSCGEPTRVGYRVDGDAKIRYCKKCKAVL
ncbi:MAG: 50S ribosomal protein L24 [Candidatus Harrisonbacteria bacterium]|nr:50S ribosomal protein L24 [Candidatus Harrisonbacteria bacterium]